MIINSVRHVNDIVEPCCIRYKALVFMIDRKPSRCGGTAVVYIRLFLSENRHKPKWSKEVRGTVPLLYTQDIGTLRRINKLLFISDLLFFHQPFMIKLIYVTPSSVLVVII